MKISKASLPYPVLGREDDYIGNAPKAWVSNDIDSNDTVHKIIYIIEFDTDNKDILDLVKDKKAALNIELDCSCTFMRKCFRIDSSKAYDILKGGKSEIHLDINKKEYAGKVSITGYITAVEDFTLPNNKRFHSDYGDTTFDISPGDVLAVFPTVQNISLEIDWNHIFHNAGAPVKIIEDTSTNAIKHTSLDSEYIEIYLPKEQYVPFKESYETNPLLSYIMLTTMAKPSIMEALIKLYSNPAHQAMWADAIRLRIDSEKCFMPYRPSSGEWCSDSLSSWENNFDKIASLILKEADKKMFDQCKQIVNQRH